MLFWGTNPSGILAALLVNLDSKLPARGWKYNPDIEEYFVEDDTVVKLKKADIYRQVESTALDDTRSEWAGES